MAQREKIIEQKLLNILKTRPEILEIIASTSGAKNLADLPQGQKPQSHYHFLLY